MERFPLDLRGHRLARFHNVLLIGERSLGVRTAEEVGVSEPEQRVFGVALRAGRAREAGAERHKPALPILEENPIFAAVEQVTEAQKVELLVREGA